jgi:hypothetical protein
MTPFKYTASPSPAPSAEAHSEETDAPPEDNSNAVTNEHQVFRKWPFSSGKTAPTPVQNLTKESFIHRPSQNPRSSKIPNILLTDPSTKAVPPLDVVSNVERTRKGTANDTEGLYQAFITPPVRQRTLPIGVEIDPNDLVVQATLEPQLNTSTWDNTAASLAPPIGGVPMSSPGARTPSKGSPYDISRPTCSLNIVCYRSGAKGCELRQIQTVLESRFKGEEAFQKTCARNPHLITTDKQLFVEIRRLYTRSMCGFWRRHFSLKTLCRLRVLSVCSLVPECALPPLLIIPHSIPR